MPTKARTYLLLTLLAAIFIALGYLRDFFFVNINYTLGSIERGDPAYAHSFFAGLENWAPNELIQLKYLLTGVFTLLNGGLGLTGIQLLFGERKYLRWTVLTYIILTAIAAIFFLGGKVFGFAQKGYLIALEFMHALQSPVVVVILGFGFYLDRISRQEGAG